MSSFKEITKIDHTTYEIKTYVVHRGWYAPYLQNKKYVRQHNADGARCNKLYLKIIQEVGKPLDEGCFFFGETQLRISQGINLEKREVTNLVVDVDERWNNNQDWWCRPTVGLKTAGQIFIWDESSSQWVDAIKIKKKLAGTYYSIFN